jgi:hypothetical protein
MIKIRQCKHCNVQIESGVSDFANHTRWCAKNPKVADYKKDNATRGQKIIASRFGTFQNYDVKCNVCSKCFQVNEREKIFPSKKKYFCSKICACSVGGKARAIKHYLADSDVSYLVVAWRYHERKCVVCKEVNVVAVHHLNGNHDDNDPKNLVPLCPTHHTYMHSRHKTKIINIVNDYVVKKWSLKYGS